MELPFMKLYPLDFHGDSRMMGLTGMQKALWLALLIRMWMEGGKLRDNDPYVAGLLEVDVSIWNALKAVLIEHRLLRRKGGYLTSNRLTKERAAILLKSDAARESAGKRWDKDKTTRTPPFNKGGVNGNSAMTANGPDKNEEAF